MFGLDRFVWETKSDSNHFGMTQAEHDSAKAAWEKYRFKIYEADIGGQWPFENDFADLTISNAVFEHLNGTHKLFLQETFRVLKPGGIFFMSTPNIASILKRIRFLIGRSPNWELKDFYQSGEKFTGHTREFTVKECVQMVEWAGFEIIRSAAVPTYGKWKWIRSPKKWPSLIAFALGHLSSTFGDHVFILAKKPR
jgi:SAM-dependent methyltransferase